jgi:hypothetical protein
MGGRTFGFRPSSAHFRATSSTLSARHRNSAPPAGDRLVVSDQKITLREMCASGVRGLLIDCSDYKCAHSVEISADRWGIMFACPTLNRCSPVRLAGKKGADVQPNFD